MMSGPNRDEAVTQYRAELRELRDLVTNLHKEIRRRTATPSWWSLHWTAFAWPVGITLAVTGFTAVGAWAYGPTADVARSAAAAFTAGGVTTGVFTLLGRMLSRMERW